MWCLTFLVGSSLHVLVVTNLPQCLCHLACRKALCSGCCYLLHTSHRSATSSRNLAWTTAYMQMMRNNVSFCPGGDDRLNTIDHLCSCLKEIGKWSWANLLKLNDEKTDVVVFDTKHKLPLMKDIRITIGEATLKASSNVRNLGVVFDSLLYMTNHISAICRTAYMHLHNISCIRR